MPNGAIDEFVVVIPANDEETLLPACLSALDIAIRTARAAPRAAARIRVVVVLDDCVDGSGLIAAEWPGIESLEVGFRNVGAARAAGVEYAIETSTTIDHRRIWIANTDADSRVPADWIVHQLTAARNGIGLIVGNVVPNPRDITAGQLAEWERRHAAPRQGPHVYGANLGVRADTYIDAGGFANLSTGEDVSLVERLTAIGTAVAVSVDFPVLTSARTAGRAPRGFADYVRDL